VDAIAEVAAEMMRERGRDEDEDFPSSWIVARCPAALQGDLVTRSH
jgi:hypothetical protein